MSRHRVVVLALFRSVFAARGGNMGNYLDQHDSIFYNRHHHITTRRRCPDQVKNPHPILLCIGCDGKIGPLSSDGFTT